MSSRTGVRYAEETVRKCQHATGKRTARPSTLLIAHNGEVLMNVYAGEAERMRFSHESSDEKLARVDLGDR